MFAVITNLCGMEPNFVSLLEMFQLTFEAFALNVTDSFDICPYLANKCWFDFIVGYDEGFFEVLVFQT